MPVRAVLWRAAHTAPVAAAWLVGEALVRATHAPVSGGVVGMLLLVGALATGRLKLDHLRGADWLLVEMPLFFIPAILAVLDHPELLGLVGLKALAVLVCSTFAVMLSTGLVAEWLARRAGEE